MEVIPGDSSDDGAILDTGMNPKIMKFMGKSIRCTLLDKDVFPELFGKEIEIIVDGTPVSFDIDLHGGRRNVTFVTYRKNPNYDKGGSRHDDAIPRADWMTETKAGILGLTLGWRIKNYHDKRHGTFVEEGKDPSNDPYF